MRLIDADLLQESLLESFEKAVAWYEETKMERAEQAVVTFAECLLRIKEQPTAEPNTGRWMFPEPPIHKPICSECGKPCIGLHAFAYALTDYCPNCGARMEGEDNATD